MGILRDTITGIPRAAGRLSRDVGNMAGGIGSLMVRHGGPMGVSGAVNIQGDDSSRNQYFKGANDLKGAFQGRVPSYKKGGKVGKTGLAYLHKGEKVLTVAKTKALEAKKEGKNHEHVYSKGHCETCGKSSKDNYEELGKEDRDMDK